MANHQQQNNPQPQSKEAATQTALDSYLMNRGTVTAEDLDEPFRDTDIFELPTVGGNIVEDLPKGKQFTRPKNIQDVNGELKYVWLDEKASRLHPRFRIGFYLVMRGNAGATNVPDKHFNSAGVIQRGEHYLWFCTMKHYIAMRKAEDEPLYGQLVDYHKEDASTAKWAKANNTEGFTQQTSVKHGLVDDEDDDE